MRENGDVLHVKTLEWQFLANYTGDLLVLLVAIATITVAAEVRTSFRPYLSSPWASTLALLPFIPPSISHVDGIQVLVLLNLHLGYPFMLLEIAHSIFTEKVSSTNASTQTRASIDSLLARFNERLYDRYDYHGHDNKHCHYAVMKSLLVKDAMLHETNDEIVDMAPKLRKHNIVHINVIDKPLQGLTLPLVTYNFVDESEVIDQNNNLFEPSLTTNVERAGKTNMIYTSQTPIELPSTRKQLIRRFKHDILQVHSDKEKGCENSASNDALIGGEKQIVIRKAINPSENDSPENEGGGTDGKVPSIAEIFKANRKRKDDTLNEEDATLYVEHIYLFLL
ncbi:hypothetical protein Cgig2_028995 [Carnegiea gigantea]|uniref:Uncharacterized protein n=1 Tax=Carnegiea gigantea TaxID=171969 RepID=A0A9Q1QA14_9CARY|nr:hypothetical protein Cgig2_028995 [Carnegiea gigantea]